MSATSTTWSSHAPDPYHPSPPAPVDCEAAGDRWTLVFTRDLHHPPGKVWAALTEPGQLAAWAPCTADRDLSGAVDFGWAELNDQYARKFGIPSTGMPGHLGEEGEAS